MTSDDDALTAVGVAEVDEMLTALADVPPTPDQIVSKGMPWGGLQAPRAMSRA